jgi:hypothetical protein
MTEIAETVKRGGGCYMMAYNQPMIALLVSFDVGFAFAHIDHRHAPR